MPGQQALITFLGMGPLLFPFDSPPPPRAAMLARLSQQLALLFQRRARPVEPGQPTPLAQDQRHVTHAEHKPLCQAQPEGRPSPRQKRRGRYRDRGKPLSISHLPCRELRDALSVASHQSALLKHCRKCHCTTARLYNPVESGDKSDLGRRLSRSSSR